MSRDIYTEANPNENIRCTCARYVPSASRRMPPRWGIRRVVQAAVPGLCLLLTACGGNMDQPKIELNPHPKMHYAITITLTNVPGPFDSIDASADYGVTDYSCVPEQPVSGARLLPRKHVDLTLRRTSTTTYNTDIYVDLMQDEDYYSKGTCRWSISAVSAVARRGRMSFITPLTKFEYPTSSSEIRYFSFAAYQRSGTDMLNTGNEDRNAYPNPSQTFSIQVDATEMQQ